MSTLHLVSTPIGNLEDITLRAIRFLGEVSLVAAEDTRTARKLFSHHGIQNRLVSYNEHNMRTRTPQLIRALDSGDIALISEAGTPGISDPGFELITAAIAAGHNVSPVPGPAAPIAALTASGLPFREFTFIAFLPRRATERRRLFASLAEAPRTLVCFESPHRVRAALSDIAATLGDRRVAVCRELTKLHEEVFRGTVSEAIAHFAEPRGEFTLVIEGAAETTPDVPDEELRSRLNAVRKTGVSTKDAVSRLAKDTGLPRRRIYALSIEDSP